MTTEQSRSDEPTTRTVRRGGAWFGVAAGLVTLGVATVLAAGMELIGASSGQPAPIAAVAEAFIDRTPAWLKDAAISAFGTNDKLALLSGVVVVLTVACVLLGRLSTRRLPWALGGFAILGAVGLAAVASRPGFAVVDLIPTVVGVAAGMMTLSHLTERAAAERVTTDHPSASGDDDEPSTAGGTPSTTRRSVVVAAAGGAAALLASRTAGGTAAAGASRAAAQSALPAVPSASLAVPAGAQLAVPGLSPWLTPNTDFYRIDTAIVVPRLDAESWKLRVTGMVEREVELDWKTLLSKPLQDATVTLTCVSNEVGGDLIGNAVWTGWPVRELLALAGPKPGADMVLQTSADNWTCSTPLEALTDNRDALLAVRMNGEALPFEHGFPVRLVVPGLYGYVSATKWVTELKVTRFADDVAYWTPRGWSERGPIKTASRIDVPATGAKVAAGRVAVAGVAWAQHRGIRSVEVSVDDGPWQSARLADEPTIDAWRQWVHEWQATPGNHTIRVRATDGTGAAQPTDPRPPAPDGAQGLHTITVTVN